MKLFSAMELVQRHSECDVCNSYGEPGYSDPKSGILFANWNDVPSHIHRGLERRGFELEWSDEWIIEHESGKAYRTSPDCYGWTPYHVITEGGDVIGGDEIESGDQTEWYVEEYLLNSPRHACVFKVDLTKFGFEKHNGEYETGFHPGQNDDARKVYKELSAKGLDVIFAIDGVGQFDVRWTAWTRPQRDV